MNYQSHSWPPERFFWATLESDHTADQLGTRQARLHLESLLEPHLPVSPDEVHTVYRPIGDGKILACATARSDLDTIPLEWIALTPTVLPEFISHLTIEPSSLNVLVRDFEPQVFRHSARRRTLIACAAMVLFTVLICVGWLRRVQAATDLARSTEHEVVQAASRELGGEYQTGAEAQNALQQARERAAMLASSGKELATFDAAAALQALLAAWPHNDEVTVQNLSVTQDAVSLNVDVRGDAQAFLKSVAAPTSWKLDEPRLATSSGVARVTLVFHPPHERGVK